MASVRDLITDTDGRLDETKVGFCFGLAVLFWGTVYSTLYPDHPFHAESLATGIGALLLMHNAGQGKLGKFGGGQ